MCGNMHMGTISGPLNAARPVCRSLGEMFSLVETKNSQGLDIFLYRDPSKTTSWGET